MYRVGKKHEDFASEVQGVQGRILLVETWCWVLPEYTREWTFLETIQASVGTL